MSNYIILKSAGMTNNYGWHQGYAKVKALAVLGNFSNLISNDYEKLRH
jgi:hypothetical protein